MSAKIGWLRKLLNKEYNESRKTNNIHHQPNENIGHTNTDTEDWLKMLMCELIKKLRRPQSDPNKDINKLGNRKNENTRAQNKKNEFRKTVFTGIEDLEEGSYYTNPQYL